MNSTANRFSLHEPKGDGMKSIWRKQTDDITFPLTINAGKSTSSTLILMPSSAVNGMRTGDFV